MYECVNCGWEHPDISLFCDVCWYCPNCLNVDGHDDDYHAELAAELAALDREGEA